MMKCRIVGGLGLLVLLTATTISGGRAESEPDGAVDESFGSGVLVITDVVPLANEGISDVAVQADGKIVAVGTANSTPGGDFVILRYDSGGIPDSTFDGDGKVITDVGSGTVDASGSMAIQPDGKIVVVGSSYPPAGLMAFTVMRYLPSGLPDSSFDGDGKVTTNFLPGSADIAVDVAIQPDGKIVVVGVSDDGTRRIAIARYDTNGLLDATF